MAKVFSIVIIFTLRVDKGSKLLVLFKKKEKGIRRALEPDEMPFPNKLMDLP